jgi:hypothetical protein
MCPLKNWQFILCESSVAIEALVGKSSAKGVFSIAMFDYRRVNRLLIMRIGHNLT